MITVNGVNLRDLGFVARSRTLPRLGGERTVIQQIPGRPGGVRMGGTVGDDTLTVEGYVQAPDHATLLQRLDLLAAALRGRCVIRLSDHPDREWVGHLQQGPSRASAIGPAWITRAESVTLQWALPNPTAQARAESTVSGSGSLALGTAPSPLRVTVTNGSTAPVTRVIVRVRAGGSGGEILRELQWDGILAVSQTLVIDAEVSEVASGGANAVDGLTTASEFPVADPDEGADYMQVTVTGGGGHVVTTAYRRRWW